MQDMTGENTFQTVAEQVEADIRMLAQFHLEDHDELGKAAQRVIEFIKPVPEGGVSTLPQNIQLHGMLRAIRSMVHCGEGESVLTRVSHVARRLDRATRHTQQEEIARFIREYLQQHHFMVDSCAEYLAHKMATGEPLR